MTELDILLTTIERMRNVTGNDNSVMDWLRDSNIVDASPLEMVASGQTRLLYQVVLWEHGGEEH